MAPKWKFCCVLPPRVSSVVYVAGLATIEERFPACGRQARYARNDCLGRWGLLYCAARCRAAMSIFCMVIIAAMTRAAFCLLELDSMSIRTLGVICQLRPNLSLSQPQSDSFPPSAVSLFQ